MKGDVTAKKKPKNYFWLRLKGHFTEAFSGELLSPKTPAEQDRKEDWQDKRHRNAYRYILVVLVAVVAAIAAFNIYTQQWYMVVGTSFLAIVALTDVINLSFGRDSLASPLLIVLVATALSSLAYYKGQDYALFLQFPLLVLLPVLFPIRIAASVGVLVTLILLPALLQRFGVTAAIVVLALGITWVVSAWTMFALRKQAKYLTGIAITDPLTGAHNRRYLELQASRAIQSWARYKHVVSLLLIDIDHFKQINDSHGHASGDRALQEVVNRIRARVRETDVICRFGGEEFVLLLSETDEDQARRVAQALCDAVAESDILPDEAVTISIGVCDVTMADGVEHWFKLADNALYRAKHNGRNRVEVARDEGSVVVPIKRAVSDGR